MTNIRKSRGTQNPKSIILIKITGLDGVKSTFEPIALFKIGKFSNIVKTSTQLTITETKSHLGREQTYLTLHTHLDITAC